MLKTIPNMLGANSIHPGIAYAQLSHQTLGDYMDLEYSIFISCLQEVGKNYPNTMIGNVTMVFPDKLKLAKVIQVFKSENKSLLTNYRPISVLSFLF